MRLGCGPWTEVVCCGLFVGEPEPYPLVPRGLHHGLPSGVCPSLVAEPGTPTWRHQDTVTVPNFAVYMFTVDSGALL